RRPRGVNSYAYTTLFRSVALDGGDLDGPCGVLGIVDRNAGSETGEKYRHGHRGTGAPVLAQHDGGQATPDQCGSESDQSRPAEVGEISQWAVDLPPGQPDPSKTAERPGTANKLDRDIEEREGEEAVPPPGDRGTTGTGGQSRNRAHHGERDVGQI